MTEQLELQSRVIETKPVQWKKLQFIQHNQFKELAKAAREKLKESMRANQFSDPFKVWHDKKSDVIYCLDGKHRTLILEELEKEGAMVPELLPATFMRCNGKREAAKLVLLYSSIYAKITEQGLFDFLKEYDFSYDEVQMTIDIPELDTISFQSLYGDKSGIDPIVARSLQERFIIPPFSIFDSRQGYWQDRKKVWQQLFNSQETREDVELIAKSGQAPAVYELRNKMRVALGREPEWDEILAEAEKRGMHIYSGASVFDPVLCEVLYQWFCPPGGSILDPFAGGSVRGIVAGMIGLHYEGIDLREEQCIANRNQWSKIPDFNNQGVVSWIAGDSNVVLENGIKETFDFVFSCPPYHDLEVYSDNPADLSNMSYGEFRLVYHSIIKKALKCLKPNRFACFVVGDIRDEKGFYRDFVSDTIAGFTNHVEPINEGKDGFYHTMLYNEIILINVAGSLPVRVGRQFENSRKVGKMHQNVLVFYKGDPKKIKEEFNEIKLEEYLQELNYQPNIALTTTE